MIELILPYPPSVNHYKTLGALRVTKQGGYYQPRINSDETKRFYFEVWHMIQQKKAKEGLKIIDDATIELEAVLWVHPPDKRRSDIDNRIKLVLDSLQRADVFINDYQISRLVVERKDIIKGGQIICRISQR